MEYGAEVSNFGIKTGYSIQPPLEYRYHTIAEWLREPRTPLKSVKTAILQLRPRNMYQLTI